MGGDIVSVHVGQAGVQIGNAVWELYCLEHLIYPDGTMIDSSDNGCQVLFYEVPSGQRVPRAIFADLEPTCVDEIRVGAYHQLFGPETLITGKEDAASNFARGYYTVGNEMSELCCERLRKQVETCDAVEGIAIFRGFAGGTGSGFAANVMNKIHRDYEKVPVIEFCIFPSPRISTIIVEPYNAVLTAHSTIETGSCSFLFNNESLYDILDKHLKIPDPTYTHLNRLMAQVVSGVTTPLRFTGSLNIQLLDFQTNLVPYPRIHYPLVAFTPFLPPSTVEYDPLGTEELIKDAFRPDYQMVKVDPTSGKYISCVLFLRGDVPPNDVNQAIAAIKQMKGVQFVDYSPAGFKVGSSYQPMTQVPGGNLAGVPRSLVMISSHSAVGGAWERLNSKFGIMFGMRAFIHHYVGEGMEEREFTEAQEDIKQLVEDFNVVGS